MKKIRVHYIPSVQYGVFRKNIFGGRYLTDWVPDWLKSITEWAEGIKPSWTKH